MSFPYKTILVIGATSGIGLALSEKFIENGSHVISVGRRQENLDSFVEKHGSEKASSFKFDITKLTSIPEFVKSVTKAHPKLDCVFMNSGIQKPLDFTKPAEIDLELVDLETTTNYTSYLHLTTYFLPFLQAQSSPTSLIFTTSGLALVPITFCPNYCASKAAMHHLIMTLREQLNSMEKNNVRVVEVIPPAVKTDLGGSKGKFGLDLEEYTSRTWEAMRGGRETIPVGTAEPPYEEGGFETIRANDFANKQEQIREMMKKR